MRPQLKVIGVALVFAALDGCAPQPRYRTPIPPRSTTAPTARAPQAPTTEPPPAPVESARRLPPDSKIREQDIRSKTPAPVTPPRDAKETVKQPSESRASSEPVPQPTMPPLPDDSSLLAKITPGVSPQRAASLRLIDEGRKLLDAGDPGKALARLEQSIVIDSTNPYGYFYLAKGQHRLGHYKESLNFLDIAESRLSGEPFWLAEVHALRGENLRAQGQTQKAEASYLQSLRLNSGNRTAAEALARMQGDAPAAPK